MAEEVLRNTRFWLEGQELTGQMNETRLDMSRVMKDKTVFGDVTENFAAGIKQVNMVHGGLWNAAEPDAQFFTGVDTGGLHPAFVAVSSTIGDPAYMMQARQVEYLITGEFGELLAFQVALQAGDNPFLRGSLMFASVSTGVENGTAIQLGALSSSQSLYVAASVTAFTGTDVIVNIESDDHSGMTSATGQGTPLTFTGIDGQWASIAGAIGDDWWRVRLSGTYTSATVAVVFGIL